MSGSGKPRWESRPAPQPATVRIRLPTRTRESEFRSDLESGSVLLLPLYGDSGRHGGQTKEPECRQPQGGPAQVKVPFLGGPSKAKEMSKSKGDFRLATLQGKDEWEAESLSVMLNRYAQATQKAYQAQWVWWQLFCNRRGLSPWRNVRRYDATEEQLLIEFALHTAVNGDRAPGTVKVRLAAVRSLHLTAGLPDPTAHTPRLSLVLAGLKRRYGTKERRRPVTPRMLSWLRAYLLQGSLASHDAALQLGGCGPRLVLPPPGVRVP